MNTKKKVSVSTIKSIQQGETRQAVDKARPRVHDYSKVNTKVAYDKVSEALNIKPGDLIKLKDGIAVQTSVWPIIVEGSAPNFQVLAKGSTWKDIDAGAYETSIKLAHSLHTGRSRAVEALDLPAIERALTDSGLSARNILGKGFNVVANDKQYAVQLFEEGDAVKVAVAAKRGGKLLDQTAKNDPADITRAVLALVKLLNVDKRESLFMTADEALIPQHILYIEDEATAKVAKSKSAAKFGEIPVVDSADAEIRLYAAFKEMKRVGLIEKFTIVTKPDNKWVVKTDAGDFSAWFEPMPDLSKEEIIIDRYGEETFYKLDPEFIEQADLEEIDQFIREHFE